MVLVPVPWDRRKDYGTVLLEDGQTRDSVLSQSGRVSRFLEKDPDSPSNLCNASIYMIEMELLRELDGLRTEARHEIEAPFYDFGRQVFSALLGKLPYISLSREFPLFGIRYDGEWFDVGQKRDYLRVNRHLLDGDLNCTLPYEQMPWGHLGTNVAIDFSRVTILPPVMIGNNCTVEPGVTLGPYAVIGDGWVIQSGSSVRNSVLWEMYPFFDANGTEVSVQQRRLVEQHEIGSNVTIDGCIVSGGAVQSNLHDETVEVMNDGELSILSIDYTRPGPRA